MALQENIYKTVKKTFYISAGFAGGHVVGFGDLSVGAFRKAQDTTYSYILHLIDYIAHVLHLWYTIYIFKEICRKPISQHPGLGDSLGVMKPVAFGVWRRPGVDGRRLRAAGRFL